MEEGEEDREDLDCGWKVRKTQELEAVEEEGEEGSRDEEVEEGGEEGSWEAGFVERVIAVKGEEIEFEDDVDVKDVTGELHEIHAVFGNGCCGWLVLDVRCWNRRV
jgi:hypothetical protein